MPYTNSTLVSYTALSPNHSGERTHSIDRITPHCVVGQLSAESICSCFASSSVQASCNYGIGTDGRVSLCVEEKNRSWCSSSRANDQRAITIECASDMSEPYAMNSSVYNSLIELCTDICKRNGKKKLLWLVDEDTILNYEPTLDEMVITCHRFFENKSCPGDWLYSRLSDLASKVTAKLGGGESGEIASGTQPSVFNDLTGEQAAAKIGELCKADMAKSGVLASVSAAQFILESSYGKSELAQNACNFFGMKCSLSGNTWSGSAWDGKSKYIKETQEEYTVGQITTIAAEFRKYGCVEDSIADHSAYLNGAMNGSKIRYEGLKGCMDYRKAIQIIKDGGYATDSAYVDKVCAIIEKYNLNQYDGGKGAAQQVQPAQAGYGSTQFAPYTVRISIPNLNIRKGPGTDQPKTGKHTGKGIFTIVEEADGEGAAKWGLLKSYQQNADGWISLDYAERV